MGELRAVDSIEALIGNTPLLRLGSFGPGLYAKLEYFNPAGSVKDRTALFMLRDAEEKGLLKPGSTVIEPTSGNTGIALAALCAAKSYKALIVMPDNMSEERKKLISAYGAQLVLTPAAEAMSGALKKAAELHKEIPSSIIAGQFDNPANKKAHFETTGPEIWRDTDGKVELLVAGVGTGGTITGAAAFLKKKNKNIRTAAAEPADSPLLGGGTAGPHRLQGIGADFIPPLLERSLLDEVIGVTTEEAYEAVRALASKEGVLVGISSGAALSAALKLKRRPEYKDKLTVVIFPDSGERYLSTKDLF